MNRRSHILITATTSLLVSVPVKSEYIQSAFTTTQDNFHGPCSCLQFCKEINKPERLPSIVTIKHHDLSRPDMDGHQKRTSPTTSENSSTTIPGHSNFILEPFFPNDWRVPQNDALWQGVTGTGNRLGNQQEQQPADKEQVQQDRPPSGQPAPDCRKEIGPVGHATGDQGIKPVAKIDRGIDQNRNQE